MFILVNHSTDNGINEIGRYDTREEAATEIANEIISYYKIVLLGVIVDRYRRVNKWWEDKDRECTFCHSKLSVKYDVPILVPSDGGVKETWVPCCNKCVWHCVFGAK